MSESDRGKQFSRSFAYLPSKYLNDSSIAELHPEQFSYHPHQICSLMINVSQIPIKQLPYSRDRLLKWIALACFCQPVLVSQAQKTVQILLNNQPLFSNFDHQRSSLILQLEILNIFCLVKGFNLEILRISHSPINNNDQYSSALWKNALPYILKNQLYQECQIILSDIDKQSTLQVRKFISKVCEVKSKVEKNLLDNNYYEDNYRNMEEKQKLNSLIHYIDIQLSKHNCLVSAQYLPDDYKGQYIEIWVNRTVQLNSLLGNFVCKERFGEFEYVKGPLAYAMEKGIMLVLNNFEHISNQLLVGMRTLAEQMKIYHNQKTFEARGGFKILGICSVQKMSTKMKSMVANSEYIFHLNLPKRTAISQIPSIQNQVNKKFLVQKLLQVQQKKGLLSSRKLWKRIVRIRKAMIESNQKDKLWQSFFTQGFKDSIELEINDLNSISDPSRTIHYQQKYNKIQIGRTQIPIIRQASQKIVKTQYSLSILQRLALCCQLKEAPLLISETGCGKTTLVQYLAEIGGHRLFVYNMSSGTDVMDLVGGFKPIDGRSLLKELFFVFLQKFKTIPGSDKNEAYLQDLMKLYHQNQLKSLLASLSASISKIKQKISDSREKKQWDEMKRKFDNLKMNLSRIDSNLVFSFLQGNLIKAMRDGDWVLIDQINMATNDVLQKIVPLIEGKSLLLYEKGDLSYIDRHENFRIIACMNPANDSGKKPLPPNLMQKFTVINLSQPSRNDIEMMVRQITPLLNASEIANIYFKVKLQKTVSLRNLSRCLSYLNRNKDVYTFKRALYDALLLGFQAKQMLKEYQDNTAPKPINGFVNMHGFLVQIGKHKGQPEVFHLTDTFLQHLKDFLRAIAGTQLPVLLQGPTSAGKTSIIRFVASASGHKCVRINNHEHTQIEQYLGNYFPDKQGKLVFRQGPLVQAVRQGHWLILDQLNLARTQILQCLNRLLDDNRQLFIPEQQIHIKPHKNFRIFATQNPASYSGRKTLSRAFRNRFISLSFDDITIDDTMAIMKVRRPILNDSKQLAAYVKKTLESLQNYRQKQRVFSKDSVITIRDLLKWTGRKFSDKQSFMKEGYALLTERLRTQEQKKFVQSILFSGSKNENFDMSIQYQRIVRQYLNEQVIKGSKIYVQMNKSFIRMAALTLKAVMNNEAVLLVGETGCGKTTLAQLLASISGRKFYSINCHKHTEASDLLGCLRPCVKPNSLNKFQFVNGVVIDAMLDGAVLLIDQINTAEDSVLERLNQVLQSNTIGVERGEGWETVTAKQGFCIIATMNPSGDYGKKQLSPALRNRFTQIWVQPITHTEYIEKAEKDIRDMITHKLSKSNNQQIVVNSQQISALIFKFVKDFNCELAPKYSLTRKFLTMRDIGWICKFMSQCDSPHLSNWQHKYYWALRILAIEGVNFMMGDLTDSFKLTNLRQQLIVYIENQLPSISSAMHKSSSELQAIQIVKQLNFPLLIKTDLPLQLLGVRPNERIFFSPHTELSDLLGQFRPKGTQFIWEDQSLLKGVKMGERVALMDLNLAQQPVIEGINSLFDHRGSIFVVELNQMFVKHQNFKPIVVLKQTASSDRRGLPNSFLNRFIKIRVKDVSKQKKISYLKQKFNKSLTQNQRAGLWNYIQKTLQQNANTKIQMLQYICSLFYQDECYLQKAIDILGFPKIQSLSTTSTLPSQQKVMQLVPLRTNYVQNSTKMQNRNKRLVCSLVNCYITLKNSTFSICLIGNVRTRQNIVQQLGYLLNKKVVKVILSTMTDMAELLGSYEQVDAHQQQQQSTKMEEQLNAQHSTVRIDNALKKRALSHNFGKPSSAKAQTEKVGTSFRYVSSRIIKTLQRSQQLLYIQVPNQMMLERVEKGIKAVYQQKVQIIIGIDYPTHEITNNTKFIPIVLPNKQTQTSDRVIGNLNESSKYFKQNHTNLTGKDKQIRMDETEEWINYNCGQESNRSIISAWQRLYKNIKDAMSNQLIAHQNENLRTSKLLEIQSQLWRSVGLEKQNKVQQAANKQANSNWLVSKQVLNLPISKNQYQLMLMVLSLFSEQRQSANGSQTISNNEVEDESKLNIETNQIQIAGASLASKFQYLYITDFDEQSGNAGFRQQAKKLLTLCICYIKNLNTKQIVNYTGIFNKFCSQIQRLYAIAQGVYHKQMLIRYSQQQYKIIPIVSQNCRKSLFHYALSNMPQSVNRLMGLSVDPSIISAWQVEKDIIHFISYLGTDFQQVATWVTNVTVRDLGLYQIIHDKVINSNINYTANIRNRLIEQLKGTKIWKSMYELIPIKQNQAQEEIGYQIFNAFRPDSNLCVNLIPHIKTQAQLKCLQSLINQDSFYLQVYRKLCQVKYQGYQPNSFKIISQRMVKYQASHDELKAKCYVYRGYDNLKLLKNFYQQLIRVCKCIQHSQFDGQTIKNSLLQLYGNYYQEFKDILWPILLSLIIIYAEKVTKKYESQTSISRQLLKLSNSSKSFEKAVNLILQKQQEEFHDAAKDYTKLQRKFLSNVIVDEYTEEAVKKNKENDEEDYKQFFGKLDADKPETILDELYMLVRKRVGCKFQLKLLKNIFSQVQQFQQFVIALQLKYDKSIKQSKINIKQNINIYQQYSLAIVQKLSQPLPKILEQTKSLVSKYNIDSVKIVATLCNKIQQHKAHEQVYKILVDCQFLITKIYEVNSVLPMAERINTESIQGLCLDVRRIQLKNWKSMLDVKINRIQKADTLDFIHFYRNFVRIGNIGQSQSTQSKQCFTLCDQFMRHAKISCYEYRLYLLGLVSQNISSSKPYLKHNVNKIVNFYSSLREQIGQFWESIKKQKVKQVSQYEKLAKWDSNRYLIFREGCEKFQKKIHHILKKYEEELSIQVGNFHNNHRSKHICQSMEEFTATYKMKQQAIKMFEETELQLEGQTVQKISNYEEMVGRIFQTLEQVKQQHHNMQSKMLLIRGGLAQLEQFAETFPIDSHSKNAEKQSQIIVQEMFPEDKPEYYKKAVKYYFGMWDKLCQKTQTAWNRDIVQSIWAVAEKIWVNINCKIPKYNVNIQAEFNEQTDNILIMFDKFFNENEEKQQFSHHSLFITQLDKIKQYIRQKQSEYLRQLDHKYPKIEAPEQVVALMKIGYIVASIALNLQKNGLCVKQNQEEAEQSGTEEIGDGVGIGQGQAHEGAQNVGDQIQFQEQVQGHKGEEKNNDPNAGKKDQNDIQMQGDFQGDMYSKSQQQEGEQQQGQQKQADQKMGEVDNQERQQDMKNEKGKAEGQEEADVQINGQQEGSQQLVDNQQQQKQARKGQNRENLEDSEQDENKSDWDDNNEQGQKINKQNAGQMEQQNEEDKNNQSFDQQMSGEEEGEEKSNNDNQEDESGEQQNDKQNEDNNNLQQQVSEQGNKQGQIMEQQIDQLGQQKESQQQKQKKTKKTRKTNLQAYGRQDMNSDNPLKNNENEMDNNQKPDNGGAAQAEGAAEGQKGTGEPVHSLSQQLLKQIQNLERVNAKQNTNFMKDLNVVAQDQNNQSIQENQQNREQQQYQLTEQQNKLTTNLPAFLDSQQQKKEQKKEQKQQKQQKQRKQQQAETKKQSQKKNEQKKSKIQKSKQAEAKQETKLQKIEQMQNQQQRQEKDARMDQKEKRQKDRNKLSRQQKVLQVSEEQYLKSIVEAYKGQNQERHQIMKDENASAQLLSQAYDISKILQEQLKSVLEPMDNAQYRGDYKTGKKLNLKKIIPFIASNFRKDKIWLRRTEPSQRNYYIMLALDDTKSMKHGEVGHQALKGLMAISLALQHLSIKTCITGIRDSMNIYKHFQGLLQPNKIVESFDFSHQSQVSHDMSISSFMKDSLEQFKKSESMETGVQNKQLCFIISDGKMNKDYVRPYIRQAKKRDIIYVFIIVDSEKASILTTKSVSIGQNGKVSMKFYMSDFPFEYFLIVRNVRQLADVLATTLLQFIQQK